MYRLVNPLMAAKGVLPNRRHEVVRLNELDHYLIPLLDGTNDAKVARMAVLMG